MATNRSASFTATMKETSFASPAAACGSVEGAVRFALRCCGKRPERTSFTMLLGTLAGTLEDTLTCSESLRCFGFVWSYPGKTKRLERQLPVPCSEPQAGTAVVRSGKQTQYAILPGRHYPGNSAP